MNQHQDISPHANSPCVTAPFNNMRTLKFKTQLTNAFFATVNQSHQMFGGSSRFRLCCLNRDQRFDLVTARSAVFGNRKRICRLSFEFWSPHVIEKRSHSFTLLVARWEKRLNCVTSHQPTCYGWVWVHVCGI